MRRYGIRNESACGCHMMTVLSLCNYTGAWSAPYRDAGYDVIMVDIKHGNDVRLLEYAGHPIRGILAAPPCTHLASSGARWWASKGESALLESLAIVDACLRAVAIYNPTFWALENPVGRLAKYLGPPALMFDPCDYGDPYTKRTCLWGRFNAPAYRPVEPTQGSRMHRLPPSPDRAALRSVTPGGFSRAFMEANP